MDVDNPPRAIVVTSPKQGDGKSTVAANLAAAIAGSGQPVTLVDADLRRPTVAAAAGLDDTVGLTDVLTGRLELADALQSHPTIEGLSVLTSGARPPNPSEILGSQAMRGVIDDLTAKGMLIIDAPPLLPVTDAAVVAHAADGAFIVVSAGRTLDTELDNALGHLAPSTPVRSASSSTGSRSGPSAPATTATTATAPTTTSRAPADGARTAADPGRSKVCTSGPDRSGTRSRFSARSVQPGCNGLKSTYARRTSPWGRWFRRNVGVHRVRSGTHGVDRAQQARRRPGGRLGAARGHRGDDGAGLRQHASGADGADRFTGGVRRARPARRLGHGRRGAPRQAGLADARPIEPNLFGSVASRGASAGPCCRRPAAASRSPTRVTPGSFTTTLDLGEDDLAGLFRGYRGDETILLADVAPSVSETRARCRWPIWPFAEVEPVSASAAWTSYTAVRVETTDVRLTAEPQPSVGRLRIAVTVPTATYANANPPAVSDLAPGWMVDPLLTPFEAGGGWVDALRHRPGGPHLAHGSAGPPWSGRLQRRPRPTTATGFFRENASRPDGHHHRRDRLRLGLRLPQDRRVQAIGRPAAPARGPAG